MLGCLRSLLEVRLLTPLHRALVLLGLTAVALGLARQPRIHAQAGVGKERDFLPRKDRA